MTKIIVLLAFGFMMGCSNSGKKATTDTKATPAAAATPAQTAPAAPATTADSKKEAKQPKTVQLTDSSDSKVAANVTCSSGDDVRKLTIVDKNKGCELEYTKAGQASSIASQIIGNAKCEEVSSRVQEKLVAAGFSCK